MPPTLLSAFQIILSFPFWERKAIPSYLIIGLKFELELFDSTVKLTNVANPKLYSIPIIVLNFRSVSFLLYPFGILIKNSTLSSNPLYLLHC